MKTKEEIAEKHGFMDGMSLYSDPGRIRKELYAAMEEYADQFKPEVFKMPQIYGFQIDFVPSPLIEGRGKAICLCHPDDLNLDEYEQKSKT